MTGMENLMLQFFCRMKGMIVNFHSSSKTRAVTLLILTQIQFSLTYTLASLKNVLSMEPARLTWMAAIAFAAYKYTKQEQKAYIFQAPLLAFGFLSNLSCL